MDAKGVWSFSPVYDIIFSNGPRGEHSMTYLGEGKNPTKEHLVKLAKKHGLKKAQMIVDEVERTVSRWSKFAKIAGVSKESERTIGKVLNKLGV